MNPDANHPNDLRLHAESSKVKAWVIPAKEEQMIAADAFTLLGATSEVRPSPKLPPLPR